MRTFIEKFWRIFVISSSVGIGFVLNGFLLGWSSPMVPILGNPELTPLSEPVTSVQASWVGTILLLGGITGPYVSGSLSKLLGRRLCLLYNMVISAITWVVLLLCTSQFWLLMVVRFLFGIYVGINFIVGVVYIAEISPVAVRGTLISSSIQYQSFGFVVVYTTGAFLSYTTNLVIGFLMTLFYIFILFLLPDVPTDLVMQGKYEEAKKSISTLRGSKDDHTINCEIKLIEDRLNIMDRRASERFLDIFMTKANRKAFFMATLCCVVQQISGVTVVLSFSTTIFEAAGSSIEPKIATIILGVAQMLPGFGISAIVDLYGRRILMLISSSVITVVLFILGLYFYMLGKSYIDVSQYGCIPLISLVSYFIAYGFGLASIPATMAGELYDNNVKVIGTTASITLSWLTGLIQTATFSALLQLLGGATLFWIYAASTLVGSILVAIFLPETKGKTYEEIQAILNSD